jgi:hypothetical protein
MQTENDTSKPEDSPQQEAGEGCSGATCSAYSSACEAVAKIPSDQLHEAYEWTCEYLKCLKQRMADDLRMEQESMLADDIRAEASERLRSINSLPNTPDQERKSPASDGSEI